SIDSEWVTNEASEARKHGILVPVLIDEVQPPLEFRHLQGAELYRWRGAADDPQLQQLIAAICSVLLRAGAAPQNPAGGGTPAWRKSWWQTPAGWAVGAAALLIAAAVLVMAFKQQIGRARDGA